MKFKEFFVKGGSSYMRTALVDKAIELRYKVCDQDGEFIGGIIFHNDGDFQSVYSNPDPATFPQMDVYRFFKLTPEDVRVKPEKILCMFRTHCDKTHNTFDNAELAQDQIDRIKAIMNEGES